MTVYTVHTLTVYNGIMTQHRAQIKYQKWVKLPLILGSLSHSLSYSFSFILRWG